MAKQSSRQTVIGGRIHNYQPKRVIDKTNWIIIQAKAQLPDGFVPFDAPLEVLKLIFVFPPVTGMSKKIINAINAGDIVYKAKKPDLVDNLKKNFFDALNGIIYIDDRLIVRECETMKIYGLTPRIEVEFQVTNNLFF